MKKEKMLEIYDELIEEETKSTEEIAKNIGKLAKSERLVMGLTEILRMKNDILCQLKWMKADIEMHQSSKDAEKAGSLFGMPSVPANDGIVIDEEE